MDRRVTQASAGGLGCRGSAHTHPPERYLPKLFVYESAVTYKFNRYGALCSILGAVEDQMKAWLSAWRY